MAFRRSPVRSRSGPPPFARIPQLGGTIASACLALAVGACSARNAGGTGPPLETFPVASHCYLDTFDPAQFPWKETDCLNFEEVFQKYSYFEVRSDRGAQPARVTVKRFVRGNQVEALDLVAIRDRDRWILQAVKEQASPP